MKFQEQIKARSFHSPFVKAILNLKYTANWYNTQENALFKKFGILAQHFNVLRIVKGAHPKPVSPGEIKEVMIESTRDLTRLVDKLVVLGYLDRTTCPANRRKVDITITQQGLDAIELMNEELYKLMSTIEHISAEESELLSELLDKMRGN